MMYDLHDVSFSYPQGRNIFTELNLGLCRKENVIICGDNGSGKSTLLKLLAGILSPSSGSITGSGMQQKSKTPGQGVFYLSQEPREQLLGFTPENDLRIWNIASINTQVILDHPLLTEAPDDFLNYPFRELSSGMLQAYFLALALIASDRYLLLDEPLKSLDQGRREAFINALGTRKGMVIVSHEPALFTSLACRHLEIREGQLYEI